MKKLFSLLLFLALSSLCTDLFSQNRWIEDKEMMFKISVPQNYQTNQYRDGSDKVHAFVSRDNNVAISIRSFELPENITVDQVIQAFYNKIITGATPLVIQTHTLNGIPGKIAGYKWRYNNINVMLGAFYTIKNNIGYVVWSMIPENLFSYRSSESDAITNSFTILNQEESSKIQFNTQFQSLVSDDALIEHLIPKGSTVRSSETGQSVWNIPDAKGDKKLTMVIQNIIKEGRNLNSFMNEQIASIRKNGAALLGQSFEKSGDFYVCRYSYEYNGSRFYYTAADGPVTFYLIGFVGGIQNSEILENLSLTVASSLKKVKLNQ